MMRHAIQNGYKQIGDSSEIVESKIDMTDAFALRDVVVDELLLSPQGHIKSIGITDNGWGEYLYFRGMYNAGTKAIPSPDYVQEPKSHLAAILNETTKNRWHLTIQHNRIQRVDNGLSERKLRTLFRIICWGDEIMEATRTVQFAKATPLVLALGRTLTEKTLAAPRYYKRVSFTAPLSPEDCQTASQLVTRHSSRVRIEQDTFSQRDKRGLRAVFNSKK